MHGVERWRSNCGCSTSAESWLKQEWRAPLRQSLDWLRDQIALCYETKWPNLPMTLGVLAIDTSKSFWIAAEENTERFLQNVAGRTLKKEEKIKILKLLEMQKNAMLMYTSCGWFFDDISRS